MFTDLLHKIEKVSTRDELTEAYKEVALWFGFPFLVATISVPRTQENDPSHMIIPKFPLEWQHRYFDNRYYDIDPLIAHAHFRTTPAVWTQRTAKKDENSEVRKMYGEASEFGINAGVMIPFHGPNQEISFVSYTTGDSGIFSPAFMSEMLPKLTYLTGFLHEAARRVASREETASRVPQLSPREKQVIYWATQGKTLWETAQILGITERTITFHLQNAAQKLGTVNRQAAIARALSLGLLYDLDEIRENCMPLILG